MSHRIWSREGKIKMVAEGYTIKLEFRKKVYHGNSREMLEVVDKGLRLRCGREGRRS